MATPIEAPRRSKFQKTLGYGMGTNNEKTKWYGKDTVAGSTYYTTRRARRYLKNDQDLYQRQRNGAYDPVTFYHVLDVLARLNPDTVFRASDIVQWLRQQKPRISWDVVTVGRVVSDIRESLNDAYENKTIDQYRHYDGNRYRVDTGNPECYVRIMRLMDDLEAISLGEIEDGELKPAPKRTGSPLERCPSVL